MSPLGPVLLAAAAAALAACGTADARTKAVPVPAAYEVHEWGLVRPTPGDVLNVGGTAPNRPIAAITADKPLLYFHAKEAVQLKSVTVTAFGGRIIEHWPVVSKASRPAQVVWEQLSLTPGARAAGDTCAATFPSPTQRPCTDLPPHLACEATALATVVAASATCLTSGTARLPFLFYRSQSTTFTPPLAITTRPSGQVEVTNTGKLPIPGRLIRMRRIDDRVVTLAVPPPAPGKTLVLDDDFAKAATNGAADGTVADKARPRMPGSVAPGRVALDATLTELGMDDDERAAFLRAWAPSLFGGNLVTLDRRGPASDDEVAGDIPARTAQGESILYFLPEAGVDALTRLAFDPPPTKVRRAMAIWQAIP